MVPPSGGLVVPWSRGLVVLWSFGLALLWSCSLVLCGCQSAESKRKHSLSTLQVRLEADHSGPDRSELVNIFRTHPVAMRVGKAPFLTEMFVSRAEVIDDMGGFAMRLQFNRQGTWLLEQYSAANRGKHFAIFSQFISYPEEKLNTGRWLAAPKITQRITDGSLTFTPDASREEADQIVLGLNNIARQVEQDSKSW